MFYKLYKTFVNKEPQIYYYLIKWGLFKVIL